MNIFFRLNNDQGIALGKRLADACEKFAIVSAGVGVYDLDKLGFLGLALASIFMTVSLILTWRVSQ